MQSAEWLACLRQALTAGKPINHLLNDPLHDSLILEAPFLAIKYNQLNSLRDLYFHCHYSLDTTVALICYGETTYSGIEIFTFLVIRNYEQIFKYPQYAAMVATSTCYMRVGGRLRILLALGLNPNLYLPFLMSYAREAPWNNFRATSMLALAARNKFYDAIWCLISMGADCDTRDELGQTACDVSHSATICDMFYDFKHAESTNTRRNNGELVSDVIADECRKIIKVRHELTTTVINEYELKAIPPNNRLSHLPRDLINYYLIPMLGGHARPHIG